MSSNSGFLDEQGMIDLARKAIEDLRRDGVAPTELKRLENVLKEGGVGEAFILSNLLKTILSEISLDASQKKLLQLYRGLEDCCQSLVELSRNLFDIEAWQDYRASGYESFESYCTETLGIPASKIQSLKLIKNQRLPRPKKGGPAELFVWFFNVVEILAETKR
jgi:hypothetical protein